ncbi:DUF1173 domain-containing protein [Paraburkholderia flagellata]|uniref:DUF1173 domain-containing protein n=1 Tax=Paraburkholderia flagellata TaxID=2883241 RepID=UPI001F3BFA5D|nr:DUF1173 domain-containing protein [Paraburkholderia flagellata]
MPDYRFDDVIVADDAADLQSYLAEAHGAKIRPLCLCLPDGVPMYVAKAGKAFIIKRMPNSGATHSADCTSYRPPEEISGMSQVLGEAIRENDEDGTTALKLDFSLSKQGARTAPTASGQTSDTVRADGAKLTLRSTLHYLWDQAELNRWTPGMAGKRTWYVVRSRLIAAAERSVTKGAPLSTQLYVPEPFVSDQAAQLRQRRITHMAGLASTQKARKLMIAIGEIKEIGVARYGFKIVAKHLPDFPLMMEEAIYRRFRSRFANELEVWNSMESSHLLFIATFGLGATGIASIESIAVMLVNANWLPFEHTYDAMLLDALIQQRRRFVKGMRYNLPENKPLACAVLSDVPLHPSGVALYIRKPGLEPHEVEELGALSEQSEIPSWIWDASAELPRLPDNVLKVEPPTPPSEPVESAW